MTWMMPTFAAGLFDAVVRSATTPPAAPPDELVNPGWQGFAFTFGMAVLVALVIFDMIRRIRRLNYRAQVRQKLDEEEAAERASQHGDPQDPAGNRDSQGHENTAP